MPLLELAAQLNSTCNLKSWNLESLISSGPFPGLTKLPFSTFHTAPPGFSIFHPSRSFPLNNWMDFPHSGAVALFRAGALWPVHCHVVPFGPDVVPDRMFPTSVPSKTISSGRSSSSLGETKVRWPSDSATLGSGLAFPQRLTIWAFNCPPSWRSSNHEGYSRSGALSVKSQRPRKASTESAKGEDELFSDFPAWEYDPAYNNKAATTGTNAIR